MRRLLRSSRATIVAWVPLVLVLVLVSLVSCSSSTGVTRELTVAMRRWTASAPASYEITVSRGCFCGPDATRAVVVRVRAGQVESRRYADTGADVAANLAAAYPTVAELFAIIQDAESRDAAQIDAQYDATYGYPTSLYIDYSERIADEEMSYAMRDFHVIP